MLYIKRAPSIECYQQCGATKIVHAWWRRPKDSRCTSPQKTKVLYYNSQYAPVRVNSLPTSRLLLVKERFEKKLLICAYIVVQTNARKKFETINFPRKRTIKVQQEKPCPYSPASIHPGFVESGLAQFQQSVQTTNDSNSHAHIDRQTNKKVASSTHPGMKRLFCLQAKNVLGRFAPSALPHLKSYFNTERENSNPSAWNYIFKVQRPCRGVESERKLLSRCHVIVRPPESPSRRGALLDRTCGWRYGRMTDQTERVDGGMTERREFVQEKQTGTSASNRTRVQNIGEKHIFVGCSTQVFPIFPMRCNSLRWIAVNTKHQKNFELAKEKRFRQTSRYSSMSGTKLFLGLVKRS